MRSQPAAIHPYWFVAGFMLVTALAAAGLDWIIRERDAARFRNATDPVAESIGTRLEVYTSALRATRSLYLSRHDEIDLPTFRAFVSGLELDPRNRGVQGIGFSRRFEEAERAEIVADARRLGQEPFQLWPDRQAAEHHAIVFLEPLDRRNRAALGYDMSSEAARREAMEWARDSGQAAASARVTLVQELDEEKQAGFLIYVPVYRDGATAEDVDARRASLVGFVYGAFRVGDLMRSIFGHQRRPAVVFDLYDGSELDESRLMYRGIPRGGRPPHQSAVTHVEIAGRPWTLRVASTPAFDGAASGRLSPYVFAIALAVNVAFAFATRAQVRAQREEARVREDLRASMQQAQEAVRLRDEFLSVAGHELKTPLAALQLQIEGLSHQAEKGAFGLLPKRLVDRLKKARTHAERLDLLVVGLLDVSRIAAGKLVLEPSEVDLVALLADVVDHLREHSTRAGCEVSMRAPERVVGGWDRVRLDQVFTNLVGNAIKYGAGAPIEIRIAREGARVRVAVRDRGIGIRSEDRARIFERFERAVSERNYGGLGLGLWITRQIVEASGGRIEVDSAYGAGSTFTVELPLRSEEGQPAT